MGNFAEAITLGNKLLKKHEESKEEDMAVQLKINLSCCHFQLGHHEDALILLGNIDMMESKFNASLSSLQIGRYANAHKCLSECFALYKTESPNPKTEKVLQAQYTSILHNALQSKSKQAISDMYKTLLNAGYPFLKSIAYTGMLLLKEKNDKFESALKKIEELELRKNTLQYNINSVNKLIILRKTDKKEEYDNLVKEVSQNFNQDSTFNQLINPNSPLLMANALISKKEYLQAFEIINKHALDLLAFSVPLYTFIISFFLHLFKGGSIDKQKILPITTCALKLCPKNSAYAPFLYYVGNALLTCGFNKEALPFFELILKVNL